MDTLLGSADIVIARAGATTIIELAALLHDIADSKFNNGNEEVGSNLAEIFLSDQNVPNSIINKITHIISNISFSK